MRLSPPTHYFFLSIKDLRLPKVLLKSLIAGLVILFAEDAFLADGMVSAFVAYLLGVDEHGDVFHDKTECLSHGFAQRPGNSSQGLGRLQGHFRGIGHIALPPMPPPAVPEGLSSRPWSAVSFYSSGLHEKLFPRRWNRFHCHFQPLPVCCHEDRRRTTSDR